MTQEELDIFNAIKDLPIIKQYLELMEKIQDYERKNAPKSYIYKSTKNNDYIVVEPHNLISIKDNKYYFKKSGYDAMIKEKGTNCVSYYCLAYCNKTEKDIQELLDKKILKEGKE